MRSAHVHDHAHGAQSSQRWRLAVAFGVTAVILVAELVGAAITGSLALLTDAGHMVTDSAGLLVALIAATLADRPPTAQRTWGFARAEVVAASAQAAVLLGVGVYVVIEGVQRLFAPPEVPSGLLLVFGLVGLAGNLISLAVLTAGRNSDLNLRSAFLEVVADALGSVGVIAAAIVIALTGWGQADAVAALLIGVLIVPRAIGLLRESVSVLLETTPRGLDLDEVRAHLLRQPHVREVHDLHASQIATGLPVLTAHIVIEPECFRDGHAPEVLSSLQTCVAEHFPVAIEHSTFQLEPPRPPHAGHATHA
jgi:cobalt-zinc-cadmium efflux system protein